METETKCVNCGCSTPVGAQHTATVSNEAVQAAVEGYAKYWGELEPVVSNLPNTEDAFKAALTAATPYLTASVEVVELEWKHYGGTYPMWRACGHSREFEAVIDKGLPLMYGDFPLRINGFMSKEKFTSVEQAQAAAQADYNKRILSALKSKPVDVAAVRERCAGVADKAEKHWLEKRDATASKKESRDYETMAIAAMHVATAIRALSAAEPVGLWQDIATAPKDGESILIWKPDERMVGEYLMSAYWCDDREGFVPVGGIHKQGYYSDTAQCNQGYPTHWMPLPAAPTSKGA